jgi:pre-mRNA-processing factor 6
MENSNTRKKKASIAIEQCGNNSEISCAVGRLFWKDNKIEKARKWLEDAIQLDRTNGDVWSYYYKLMVENYEDKKEEVKREFLEIGRITHGRKWFRIKENNENGWRFNNFNVLEMLVKDIGEEIYLME